MKAPYLFLKCTVDRVAGWLLFSMSDRDSDSHRRGARRRQCLRNIAQLLLLPLVGVGQLNHFYARTLVCNECIGVTVTACLSLVSQSTRNENNLCNLMRKFSLITYQPDDDEELLRVTDLFEGRPGDPSNSAAFVRWSTLLR